MKLRNVLLVVKDLERSKQFYGQLFGLQPVLDGDENVILTEGLVLQKETVWRDAIGEDVLYRNHAAELYFEERDLERFVKRTEAYGEPVSFAQHLTVFPHGQKMLRLYDPDGHLIEVREKFR